MINATDFLSVAFYYWEVKIMSKKTNEKRNIFTRLKTFFKKIDKKRDSEYSKRLLTKITNHSLFMMWASYILAWYGKAEIAETLSKTIASTIIAVVVGYLAKSVIENLSKNTTCFGQNITTHSVSEEEINRDC